MIFHAVITAISLKHHGLAQTLELLILMIMPRLTIHIANQMPLTRWWPNFQSMAMIFGA
jgi:hypothetical protein